MAFPISPILDKLKAVVRALVKRVLGWPVDSRRDPSRIRARQAKAARPARYPQVGPPKAAADNPMLVFSPRVRGSAGITCRRP